MCLLERRIIHPTLSITKATAYSDIVRTAVTLNAIQQDYRRIPRLSLGDISGACWEQTVTLQISYANLMEWVYTICEKIGGTANIRLVKNTGEQYRMVFDLYEGSDRSIMQQDNPHIIFSDTYSNLLSFSYAEDASVERNLAYIFGQGKGDERKRTTYYNGDEPAYLSRYEVYVDADDISETEDVEGETVHIPEDKYIELLKTRGSEHLVQPKTVSESEIAANNTQYQYNKDYAVGDYVTVQHKRFGMIQPKIQLIGMIECFDYNGRSLTPTFKKEEQ